MPRLSSFSILAGSALALLACGPPSPVEPGAGHPAEVRHPVSEAELTTIILTEQAERRLGIETAEVRRKRVRPSRTYGGEIVVPPGRSVTVTAPVAGTLMAPGGGAFPTPGSVVSRDQEVFRLLPVGAGDVDLVTRETEARIRFDAASAKADRALRLLRERVGSQRQLEEARAELALAETSLRAVRNQRTLLGLPAGEGEPGGVGAWSLKAPFSGRLGGIHVAAGQTVTSAAPLFDLLAEDPLWVRVPVYVGDIDSIDRGEDARIEPLGGAASWGRTASLVAAPRSADPGAATVDLFFRLENGDGANQPGQKVAVTIVLKIPGTGEEESLVVPRSAVLYDIHGGTWVYENPVPRRYVRGRVEVRGIVGDDAVLSRGPVPGTVVVTVGAAEIFGTEFGVGH